MDDTITVLFYAPGCRARTLEIEPQLDAMRALVGGSIEGVSLDHGLQLICNEEGRLRGLPVNRNVANHCIRGNFFVTRYDSAGDNVSLTARDIEAWGNL